MMRLSDHAALTDADQDHVGFSDATESPKNDQNTPFFLT